MKELTKTELEQVDGGFAAGVRDDDFIPPTCPPIPPPEIPWPYRTCPGGYYTRAPGHGI